MSRWTVPLIAIAVLLSGCGVQVTQPLSDPDKAEPDKRLLGRWEKAEPDKRLLETWQRAIEKSPELNGPWAIDSPAVKGNPKGLMQCRNAKYDFWFFTTTISKHTYWTVYRDGKLKADDLGKNLADFGQEGAFEKWNKRNGRQYEVLLYVLEGDRLTLHSAGDRVQEVMQAELIPPLDIGDIVDFGVNRYYKTPPGWLAKYLEKNGPESLYNGGTVTWQRTKK